MPCSSNRTSISAVTDSHHQQPCRLNRRVFITCLPGRFNLRARPPAVLVVRDIPERHVDHDVSGRTHRVPTADQRPCALLPIPRPDLIDRLLVEGVGGSRAESCFCDHRLQTETLRQRCQRLSDLAPGDFRRTDGRVIFNQRRTGLLNETRAFGEYCSNGASFFDPCHFSLELHPTQPRVAVQ